MAHPKRRQSKTRTAKRRTHDKAVAPTLAICPNCGEWHVYHTVCGACGYYRGKLAIAKEAAVLKPGWRSNWFVCIISRGTWSSGFL